MFDAMRPIDVECPTCLVGPDRPCRGSTSDSFPWKRYHPERFKAVNMSPTSANLRSARRASESPIPFDSPLVVFIWNASGRGTSARHLRFVNTVEDKITLLSGRTRKVYCVWPGQGRSDLFLIDEPDKVRRWLQERPPTGEGEDVEWG